MSTQVSRSDWIQIWGERRLVFRRATQPILPAEAQKFLTDFGLPKVVVLSVIPRSRFHLRRYRPDCSLTPKRLTGVLMTMPYYMLNGK